MAWGGVGFQKKRIKKKKLPCCRLCHFFFIATKHSVWRLGYCGQFFKTSFYSYRCCTITIVIKGERSIKEGLGCVLLFFSFSFGLKKGREK